MGKFQISSIKVIDDKIIMVSPVGIYDDDPEIITLSHSDFGEKIISITLATASLNGG